jgi:hypothetical protein
MEEIWARIVIWHPPPPRIDGQVQFAKRMVREARVCHGERAYSTRTVTCHYNCSTKSTFDRVISLQPKGLKLCDRRKEEEKKDQNQRPCGRRGVFRLGGAKTVGRLSSAPVMDNETRAENSEGVLGRGPGDSRAGGGATHGTENLSEGEIDPQVTSYAVQSAQICRGMCTKKKSLARTQYHTSRGQSDLPWGGFPALPRTKPEVGGLSRRFLYYLEVISKACGRFSVG